MAKTVHRPGDRLANEVPRRTAGDPGQQHEVVRRIIQDLQRLHPDHGQWDHHFYSELPQEGDTEVWEIVNLTADAHPIHLHLVQFQLINRQNFNTSKYTTAYAAAFPGGGTDPMTALPCPPGVYIPGFGPPLNYNTGIPRGSAATLTSCRSCRRGPAARYPRRLAGRTP